MGDCDFPSARPRSTGATDPAVEERAKVNPAHRRSPQRRGEEPFPENPPVVVGGAGDWPDGLVVGGSGVHGVSGSSVITH